MLFPIITFDSLGPANCAGLCGPFYAAQERTREERDFERRREGG
jgi:sulfite exporter TauE/SafE